MATFSPEQAKLLLQKNALNLADKVKAGETLSPKELAMLESIVDGGSGAAKLVAKDQVELAAALGVTRMTLNRWMKKPGNPGAAPNGSYDIVAWRAFAHKVGRKDSYGDDEPDTEKEKAKNIRLQNEKLEHQIKVLLKEYVSADEVEKWGAELGIEIRNAVTSIHKIASSLAGIPTAEIEIRLRELEDEILMRLHSWTQRTKNRMEAEGEEK